MTPELLDSLEEIGAAFDVETWLITPKCKAPPLVCGSLGTKDGAAISDVERTREIFLEILQPGRILIGANIAFDVIVMAVDFAKRGIDLWPQIFDKYDRGEIYDVLLAEMLDAIAGGHLGRDSRTGGGLKIPSSGKASNRYSLEIVTDLVLDRITAKANDRWRLRYFLLRDIPISRWPEDAAQYPVDDAVNTWDVALAQAGLRPRGDGSTQRSVNLHAMAEMTRAALALNLGAAWAFATDVERVDALEVETLKIIESGKERFLEAGIMRVDESKDTGVAKVMSALRKHVAEAYGAAAPCPQCKGEGKGQFGKGTKDVNCPPCSGTGYDLENTPSIPRTDKGGVMTARDILVDSGSELLADYGDWGEELKTVSTYLPALREGVPLRPNVPLVNERVSYSGIVQTMPRKASAKGDISVRECIVARPGYVLGSVDFAGVEMVTWAQQCLWKLNFSRLAEAINDGKDTHSILGSDLCGCTYDEFVPHKKGKLKDYRQAAKWGNFGYAGGMGAPKFVITNRRAPGMTTTAPDGTVYKGVRFCILVGGRPSCGEKRVVEWKGRPTGSPVCVACIEEAIKIRQAWFNRWEEAEPYFNFISKQVDNVGSIIHAGSDIVRGGVDFCSAANGYFSALAAFGAKRAFWAVIRECFTDRKSALWGTRPIGFIHDEIVAEIPEERGHEAAHRMAEIMVSVMQSAVPDVIIKAEPALMRRFYKGAEPVYENERLIPWEPN